MCLVDQATSACRATINMAPLKRGQWQDIVMHAKWSSEPSVGDLEMWIDGVNALPKHMGSNTYPGMQNYLLIGLYRNGHIGDPNLLYPNGTHVFGTDGTPGVAWVDGFIAGKTRDSVLPPSPATPSGGTSTPPSGSASPSGSPEPATSNGTPVSSAGVGFPPGGGCSSTGFQSAWLAVPLFGLFALRRRRSAA